jgi:hypothetical protein
MHCKRRRRGGDENCEKTNEKIENKTENKTKNIDTIMELKKAGGGDQID